MTHCLENTHTHNHNHTHTQWLASTRLTHTYTHIHTYTHTSHTCGWLTLVLLLVLAPLEVCRKYMHSVLSELKQDKTQDAMHG